MRRPIQSNSVEIVDDMRQFVEARLSGGMITTIDPADIPTNSLVDAKGCKIFYDRTLRAPGLVTYGPTKPNSNAVLGLYSFTKDDGLAYLLRFNRAGVHKKEGTWTALTGTLTGTDANYFSFTFAFNKVYFANGVDAIQEINTGVTSFAALGNAPKYKYVTSFYNRIVGANLGGVSPNPYLLGCSGDLNFTQWDPLVDFTAASYPLIESPNDTSDPITGLFSGPNYLIIPKEKTIWLATKLPSASNPFFPFTAVPHYGCDAPFASCNTPYGLVFLNLLTKKIYLYVPTPGSSNQTPNILSTAVETELFKNISDINKVIASYNMAEDSVTFLVPSTATTTVRLWTYNFISKSWAYDEKENISLIADVITGERGLTIGEMVGSIGSSSASATLGDSVSGTDEGVRLYGYSTGEIAEEDESKDVDIFDKAITTTLVSKKFVIPTSDIYIVRLRFEFDVKRASAIKLYWSKNGKDWISAKTFNCTEIDNQKQVQLNKVIKARKFQWKLESTSGSWELIDYEIHVRDAGVSK